MKIWAIISSAVLASLLALSGGHAFAQTKDEEKKGSISKEHSDLIEAMSGGGPLRGTAPRTNPAPPKQDQWVFQYRNKHPGAHVWTDVGNGKRFALATRCVPAPGSINGGNVYFEIAVNDRTINKMFDNAIVYSVKNNQQTTSRYAKDTIDRISFDDLEDWKAADRFIVRTQNGSQFSVSAAGSKRSLDQVMSECGVQPLQGFQVKTGKRWWVEGFRSNQPSTGVQFYFASDIVGTLGIQCSGSDDFILIYGYRGERLPLRGPQKKIVEAFFDVDVLVETFRNGLKTASFRPNGFHGGVMNRSDFEALRDSDRITISGGPTTIETYGPGRDGPRLFAMMDQQCQ